MSKHPLSGIAGVALGHWTHASGTTGVTVVAFPDGAVGGVAVPGHAPGSRELGAHAPPHQAGRVDAFVLSGGSAFGLATADGVMAELAERGLGFPTSVGPVPIVPAAILFDLPVAAVRPDAAAGRAAAQAAFAGGEGPWEGRVGAGAGCRIGKSRGSPVGGGLGIATSSVGAWQVGAVVAVNAFGCVFDQGSGTWIPGPPDVAVAGGSRENTTLAVVLTDAPLDTAACSIVAQMATAGLARSIAPVFTPFDGDTVFVGATGTEGAVDPVALTRLGHAAAEVLARAVVRGVRAG